MSQSPGEPLPLSPESRGDAPGRGRLAGRRILVVGGGQREFDPATDPIGNGRAMCLLYAREGAKVAVVDANMESARGTLARLEGEGGAGVAIQADVASEADMARMVDEAIAGLGGLDGVVYNVGMFGGTGLRGFDLEEWDRILAINLRGAMLAGREALERMEPGGSLVLISSIAAFVRAPSSSLTMRPRRR